MIAWDSHCQSATNRNGEAVDRRTQVIGSTRIYGVGLGEAKAKAKERAWAYRGTKKRLKVEDTDSR